MFRSGDGDDNQGMGIWAFVAVFVALATIGLVSVVLFGSPTKDSRSTRTAIGAGPNTTTSVAPADSGNGPDGTGIRSDGTPADSLTTVTPTTVTPTTVPRPTVTLPTGEPAPSGVTRVIAAGDVLSFGFEIEQSKLGDKPLAVVPPLRVEPSASAMTLKVEVGCAQTTREQLVQVSLTETETVITVSAVTLVPLNAFGCNPSARPRELDMPLRQPIGARSVAVMPTSTKLPAVDLSDISGE